MEIVLLFFNLTIKDKERVMDLLTKVITTIPVLVGIWFLFKKEYPKTVIAWSITILLLEVVVLFQFWFILNFFTALIVLAGLFCITKKNFVGATVAWGMVLLALEYAVWFKV